MNKKNFLSYLFLYIILTFSSAVFSQKVVNKHQNFKLIKIGNVYTEQQLVAAIEKADWCGYYHKSENFRITFDDGSLVELLSYKILEQMGFLVEAHCIQDDVINDDSIYGITSIGFITRQVKKNTHIKQH